MFDDARPERQQQKIWVAAYDTVHLACARCLEEVFPRDIAFFTRTRPGDPFDPWCYVCAKQLCKWAAAGACLDEDNVPDAVASELEELLASERF